MRLFWWQQLPLLILIQLLEPSRSSYKLYVAEALLAFKSTVVSHRQSGSRVGKNACSRKYECDDGHKLKDQGVVSLIRGTRNLYPLTRIINFSPSAPNLSPIEASIEIQAKARKTRISEASTVDGGDSSVPTLTPLQAFQVKKPAKQKVAAIAGGAGAALLVIIIVVLVYMCLIRVKRSIRQTSETSSSVPSPPVNGRGGNASRFVESPSPYETHNVRQITIQDLEHATCNFSQSTIIGEGGFGLAYKGLLQDGTFVVVKRRLSVRTPYFADEVKRIADVHHKHLVNLIGYCEHNTQQFLVYDYLANGNVGNHLYDNEGFPIGKLEMRQRLLIALGAARGLEHLHSLETPMLHMHFRTSNVLVDENYTAKVSDFGLSKLLVEGSRAGSSSVIDCFLDPRSLRSSKDYSERSDVYSFGVFLLELISGREAHGRSQPNSQQNIVSEAKEVHDLESFIDKTLGDHATSAAKQMLELALLCIDSSLRRRPTMKNVVEELQRIEERVTCHLHYELGEDIGVVTLGSELFK